MGTTHNEVARCYHDCELVERELKSLTDNLTLGDDKRIAAAARTYVQIGRLLIKELGEVIAARK